MLQLSRKKLVLLLAAVAGFVLVPTAAQADASFYKTPLWECDDTGRHTARRRRRAGSSTVTRARSSHGFRA